MIALTSQPVGNMIPSYSKWEGGINMAGGYFRPKGRRYFTVWYPWKGEKILIRKYLDGTKIYHEEQAKRVLEKIRGEIDSSTFDPSSWGKVKTLLFENAWETYQEHSLVKKARMEQREMIFQRYLLPYFKGKSIMDIRTIDVQNWLTNIRNGGASRASVRQMAHTIARGQMPLQDDRPGIPPSPSYLRLIKVTFRAFLWFHSDNLVKIPKFPTVSTPKKAIIWLTEMEQEKVFEFVPLQHQPILNFIRIYGCRPSEACNLKKADIDWGKRIVTFRDRKAGDENTLPITPEIEATLRVPKKVDNLEFTFSTASGRQYRRQLVYHFWSWANKKANKRYGVKVVSLKNGTRHSKASQLLNRGESLEIIARLLGNSPKVVERSYGRITTEKVAEVL